MDGAAGEAAVDIPAIYHDASRSQTVLHRPRARSARAPIQHEAISMGYAGRVNSLYLLRMMAEANALSTLRLHRACARLGKDEFEAPRASFFRSLRATLNHILIVDWFYVDALESGGQGRATLASDLPFPALADLTSAQREVDMRLLRFVKNLSSEDALTADVHLQRKDYMQVERRGEVLLHLFSHQTHHRGQVHAMLAGTSVAPPQLDEFILREDLPLRAAELRDLG